MKRGENLRQKRGRLNPKFIDKTGLRFGRLTVLDIDESKQFGNGVFWKCKCDCGKILSHRSGDLTNLGPKSCGCLHRETTGAMARLRLREKHPMWKGGRLIAGGYVRILNPDHPRANRAGYVAEHIVVMEKKIGREVLPGETIHHINGVRSDNRDENLELWDSCHGSGQRHVEKMAFHTQEIISKASDEELRIISAAIEKRISERNLPTSAV